jgi:hypothetical protein
VAKFIQREYSARFIEVFDELVKKKIVDNMREFCKRMDYLPQNLSQVKGGKRDVTTDLIIKLFLEFGGNPVYVLLGYGNKILDKNEVPVIPKKSLSLEGSADSKLVSRLEELIETKTEYITLLKKEIDRLTMELGNKGSKH